MPSPSPERSLEDIALEQFDFQVGKYLTLVSDMETHKHFTELLPMFARRALLIAGEHPFAINFSGDSLLFRQELDRRIHHWVDASFQRIAEAERLSSELSRESAQPCGAREPVPKRVSKPGPKPDLETARKVRDLVRGQANGGDWKQNLPNSFEALDNAQIPFPKKWEKRAQPLHFWSVTIGGEDRDLAKKKIAYLLKIAKINTL